MLFLCGFPDPPKSLDIHYFSCCKLFEYVEGRERNDQPFLLPNPNVNIQGSPPYKQPLCHITLDINGKIEDAPSYCYKVDFANRVPGGGVLNHGCVQEEILFVIYPELLISRLCCESMNHNEAILVEGVERFSNYKGYSRTFDFDGDYQDEEYEEGQGIQYSKFIIIDALSFPKNQQGLKQQWGISSISRELDKAFVGFSLVDSNNDQPRMKANKKDQKQQEKQGFFDRFRGKKPKIEEEDQNTDGILATGHWGCGAFNGDHILKFIIQWIAASEARVNEMRYSCFITLITSILQITQPYYDVIKDDKGNKQRKQGQQTNSKAVRDLYIAVSQFCNQLQRGQNGNGQQLCLYLQHAFEKR
ncbi:MAG: putative poly glycohydrolase family protein [Streblomastix strix]|uniref:Putative poly glycohydrolase family protein n=1 Tax=Streblomastix strix TaxID=222440 RepID=A0A5J4W9U5_9EUKA|nr:MAG: putative poly glycohydrolase family protein [Streblomastix strix]